MTYKSNIGFTTTPMHTREGFTLLEVIIVMSIFVVIIGAAMYFVLSGQQTFDEGLMTSFLESQATRLTDSMKDDISECLVITASAPATANDYASLTIQVPVRSGGSYLNPDTGAVYWGAYDNNNNPQQNWQITYRFEPDPARSGLNALNENADRMDYNRDGDIADAFDVGRIVKEVYDSSAVLQYSTGICNDIITVAGTRYADIAPVTHTSAPILLFMRFSRRCFLKLPVQQPAYLIYKVFIAQWPADFGGFSYVAYLFVGRLCLKEFNIDVSFLFVK
jgi:prepilin-type N-terminal cleavage/methylation domain-containing protein